MQMASLDLKLRFPPHLLQKLSSANTTTAAAATLTPSVNNTSLKSEPPRHTTATTTERDKGYVVPMLACIALIVPLMGIGHHWSAPGYLIISPVPVHHVLSCTAQHHAHKGLSAVLGATAFTVGAAAAIMSCLCEQDNFHKFVYPLLSASVALGAVQLILILNKTDVAKVMVCTACAMLVGVMALVAPFMSDSIAFSCYKGVCVPLLFLFWNTLHSKTVAPLSSNEMV